MATLIKKTGEIETVTPTKKKFTLEEMYKLLNCESVEVIKMPGGTTMWIDEEGRLKTNVLNLHATAILHSVGARASVVIVGDALICDRGEVG